MGARLGKLFGKKKPLVTLGAEVLEVHLDGFRHIVRLDSGEKAIAFRGRTITKQGRVFSVGDHVKVSVPDRSGTRVTLIGSDSPGEDQE